MTEPFESIEQAAQTGGAGGALHTLVETLEEQRDFHRLFDALLLQKKFEMTLPLSRPASFDDVPAEKQAEFEEAYVAAARRVGEGLLADGNIPQAWVYLRTIREPERVTQALENVTASDDSSQSIDELIAVALYERAHPVKGLELMLAHRGTCNTISAFDQAIQQISPAERLRGAELLVRHLYGELLQSVLRDIERRAGAAPTATTLSEAIASRSDLFEEGNYHIDVSHLGSVVRFARFLEPGSAALPLAIELAEYGSQLSSQFQYPADPPFDEYYPAHRHFFRVLAGEGRAESLDYFRGRLQSASDPDDRRMIAYVLVDLLGRIGELSSAVDVAAVSLRDLDESSGFSFAQLCERAGRLDAYRDAARERGDLVGFTAALAASPGTGR